MSRKSEYSILTLMLILLLSMINIFQIKAQWLPDVRLTNDTAESRGNYGHTKWIASNGNKIYVAWKDSRDGIRGIFYRRSTDNGITWGVEERISNITENGSTPAIASTGQMVYIIWTDKIDENYGLFISRSTNYGITWSLPSLPIVNAGAGSSITCSGSSVYIAWTDLRQGNAEIYFKKSTNYGITWSSDVRITNNSTVSQFPSIDLNGNNIHIVWNEQNTSLFHYAIFHTRSTDGGTNWSTNKLIDSAYAPWVPSLSVSGSYVHVAYRAQVLPSQFDNIYSHSADGGLTWSQPVNLSNNLNSGSPSILSSGSNVHLVWRNSHQSNYGISYKRSTNNGINWEADTLISFNSAMHDNPSISASFSSLNVVWEDSKDGNREIYYKQNPSGNGLFSISGLVTYKDNNQPVTGGYVKALKYDPQTTEIYTVDSTHINSNGTYMLGKVPQDTVDLMFYQDDDLLQFVPTYYVSTIDWRQSTKVYPEQNLTNINCQVYRIENQSSPFTISGYAIGNLNNLPSGMQDAFIYAKAGNIFKNYGISIFDGSYIITKLPTGSYTLIAHRMGFAPLAQDVTISSSSLNNINFDMGNPLIGIEVVSSKIPVDYYLSQNYPNPFNPSTRIKFGIPTEGFVTVKIFDVLGRLVSTPVNENLRAGSYEINWNSEGLTSGVYFYRIESGSYIKTLKMVLLK